MIIIDDLDQEITEDMREKFISWFNIVRLSEAFHDCGSTCRHDESLLEILQNARTS